MNDKKFIIIISLFTAILLFGGAFFLTLGTSTPQIAASLNAKANISGSSTYDWGKVRYDGDLVTKGFSIKNTGSDTLKLANVKTSCHCTKARVTIGGETSPDFGMSGLSSWLGEVSPGKEARVTVSFDPKYHGIGGVGPTVRYVSIDTNDKTTPKLTLTLNGLVTK